MAIIFTHPNKHTHRYSLFESATSMDADLSSWNVQLFEGEDIFKNANSLSDCKKRRIWDSWAPQFTVSFTNVSFWQDYSSWSSYLCFDCGLTAPDGPGGEFVTYPDVPAEHNSRCSAGSIQ